MKKEIYGLLLVLLSVLIFQSCGKKEEPQTFIPPGQDSAIIEKENKEREEFERLKRLQGGDSTGLVDSTSMSLDTSRTKSDSIKIVKQNTDKKKMVQKEKELNKRLDNPKVTITDYLEFLKRGTSEGGNFEQNMKKASELWQVSNVDRFKTNYKNTKKIIVLDEPKVTSQKGNEAVVEVRIKKSDKNNGKTEDMEMTVKYMLVADSKGKWKIKDNIVVRK